MLVSTLVLAVALTGAVYADDTPTTASPDLSALLNSLPEINNEPAPVVEKPPENDPLARDENDEFADYAKGVADEILVNWDPSKKLVKSQPTAVAKLIVRLDASGTVKGVSLLESSGDDAFNKSALEAIKKTAKVKAPTASLGDSLDKGVLVAFEARSKLTVKADPE